MNREESRNGELTSISEVLARLAWPRSAEPNPAAEPPAVEVPVKEEKPARKPVVSESRIKPDIGFVVQALAGCHLPMTDPGDKLDWERVDGKRSVRLVADPRIGLPYGSHMLILIGLTTRAKETKSPTVQFHSSNEFLEYIYIPREGDSFRWFEDGLKRIKGCQFFITDLVDQDGPAVRLKEEHGLFTRHVDAWYNVSKEQRTRGKAYPVLIELDPTVMELLKKAPAIELEKVAALRKSVGAMQLFTLLRTRCSNVSMSNRTFGRIPVHGPNSLSSQLGWNPDKMPTEEKVRYQLKQWLAQIKKEGIWQDCPAELHRDYQGWFLHIRNYPDPRKM